jgi:hypothetical protein
VVCKVFDFVCDSGLFLPLSRAGGFLWFVCGFDGFALASAVWFCAGIRGMFLVR